MLDSVRSRLALWHTAILAVLLIGFGTVSYLWLQRAVGRRDDRFLEETTNAFRANIAAELAEVPLDSAVEQSLEEFRLRNVSFLLFDSLGRVMRGSSPPKSTRDAAGYRDTRGAPTDTTAIRRVVQGRSGDATPRFVTIDAGDDSQRLLIVPVRLGREAITIVAAESLLDQLELLEETRAALLIAIPLALLLAGLGGYAIARRSLAPVAAMSSRAAVIGARSLHERLPVRNPRDEIGHLATTFNALLARLDQAFDQQRRFMADASHELRTPVSIMRGEADIALSQSTRTAEEYRGALTVIRDEGRRLSRIVGELFLLARADAGQHRLQRRELYLDELVADCVRTMRSLAAGRDVTMRCFITPAVADDLTRAGDEAAELAHAYHGDEELLRRLVVNLLDNAIKHAPGGSAVDVRLVSDAGGHSIQVIDRGAGVPEDARAHVFERFYRADDTRARDAASETGGAGLGLAIARWVAEAHGGSVSLLASTPGETVFAVVLPRSATTHVEGAERRVIVQTGEASSLG